MTDLWEINRLLDNRYQRRARQVNPRVFRWIAELVVLSALID